MQNANTRDVHSHVSREKLRGAAHESVYHTLLLEKNIFHFI